MEDLGTVAGAIQRAFPGQKRPGDLDAAPVAEAGVWNLDPTPLAILGDSLGGTAARILLEL